MHIHICTYTCMWLCHIHLVFLYIILQAVIGLKILRHFLNQSIEKKNNQLCLFRLRYPALGACFMYFLDSD